MVEVETNAERRGGVTYVTAIVTNTRLTPQAVCLESRLDGPTWPPRRTITDLAWEDKTAEMTIDAGRSRGIGFASPAPPTDPLIDVLEVRRTPAECTTAPTTHLRSLADWSPTTAVLPDKP